MARRLCKIKSCKNLAKFHARFWQDNVRQEIAKTSYINLAKFLARFWQDHARQSRQEIAKMCYNILAKFLARFWQESCMILERFGTCNDIHNSRIHSTFSFLSYS